MNFLKKLQSKPPEVRSRYALVMASTATGIIAIVWMSTLPVRFSELKITETGVGEDVQNISDILNAAQDQMGNVIESADTVLEEVSTIEASNLNALGAGISNEGATATITIPIISSSSAPEMEESKPRVILIGTTTSQSIEYVE